MDLSSLFNLYQPFPIPPRQTTDFESDDSIIIDSQSTVLSVNKLLLQALFPCEDTFKTHLLQIKHQTDDNSNNDSDQLDKENLMDLDRFYIVNNFRFGSKRSQLDYLSLCDLAASSIHSDSIDHLVFNYVINNNLNLETLDFNECENPEMYHQYYDDYQNSKPNQLFTYNDYVKLRGNTLLLARLGFKFNLTINTDNDKVEEDWNPKVAQKILSHDYSPLNLRVSSNNLQSKASLVQSESFLIAEAVNALQDDEYFKLPCFESKLKMSPSPTKFVCFTKKIDSFKDQCRNDKITLLLSAFYEVTAMYVVFKYNRSTDEWISPEYGIRFGRRDFFLWSRKFHDISIPVIETFPDKWRNDEVVEALLNLIIIFNPDIVGLEFPDSIRYEQYVYIHLLKRYLESVCESPHDASDNLYRLLVSVEKFRTLLGEDSYKQMNEFEPGYHLSLRNLIIDVIDNE